MIGGGFTHTPRPETRPCRGGQRPHATKAGFGIESVKTALYTITISTTLCHLARRGKTGLVGSQPSALPGPPTAKSETFYGGSPEKVGPTNQTRRREEESSEPAPRARRATRGGRSGRLEDGLRRVRGHIIDEPRIQWLTIVMEAKCMRARWSMRPSRRRSGQRQTSSLCNRRSTHVQSFKNLLR